jgi:tetraacyldisaccharide 4'-kinase
VKHRTALRVLLWPVSLVWSVVVRLRSAAYRRGFLRAKHLPGIVISVGNLTPGGTGKTPLVLWLAERLHAEGKRVGILTRGYRSRPGVPPGEPQSDEVAIYRERLAHHVELGVGADRYGSGQVLARHGVEWFVLDDGFQHMQLARNADIVLLDATDPFGGGWMLPAGLLREPKSALTRADIIVVTRSSHTPAVEAIVHRFTNAPVFHAVMALSEILPVPNQPNDSVVSTDGQEWRNKKAFAFCGIGNPRAFFDDLKRWGVTLVRGMHFPDHHTYTPADVAKVEAQARDCGAEILLCTEKDVFNLQDVRFSRIPVYFVRIAVEISDPEEFWGVVQKAIQRRHRD